MEDAAEPAQRGHRDGRRMSPLSPQSPDQRAMERRAGPDERLAEKPLSGQDVLLGRAAGAGTAQPPYPVERSSGMQAGSLHLATLRSSLVLP